MKEKMLWPKLLLGAAVCVATSANAGGPDFDCLTLTVTNLVAGQMADFDVCGAVPGEDIAVLYSRSTGSFDRKGNGWCVNFGIRIPSNPWAAFVCGGVADESGCISEEVFVTPTAKGQTIYFQAAQRNTCPDYCMSNIVIETVQ